MDNIEYNKFILRQGKRENLPILDGGELGFTEDTGQLFVGSDPDLATHINHNIITIYPFPNARNVIQGFLDSDANYDMYEVTENLLIEVEDQEKALEVIDFINDQNAAYFGGDAVPVANLQRNIEIITEKNVHEYINPADHNIFYDPGLDFARPSKKLFAKELDSSMGGVFLEYDVAQVFHLKVDYVVIQDNGWHRRSGTISVISDNNENPMNEVGFNDEQLLYNDAINSDFIEFSAEITSGGKLRIMFDQPTSHSTKIYYRISRWNIDNVSGQPFEPMPDPLDNNILDVNGDPLGVNGSGFGV